PAAVRRLPRLGHQRQGRVDVQPAALDEPPRDQGDVRRADHHRVPAHGIAVRETTAPRSPPRGHGPEITAPIRRPPETTVPPRRGGPGGTGRGSVSWAGPPGRPAPGPRAAPRCSPGCPSRG